MDYTSNILNLTYKGEFHKYLVNSKYYQSEDFFDNLKHYSVRNIRVPFNNRSIILERNADIFIPKNIISNNPVKSFTITIGQNVTLKFPFEMLQRLGLLKQVRIPNRYCYEIPWKTMILKIIPNISLQFMQIKYWYEPLHEDLFNDECQLVGTEYYLAENERQHIATMNHEMLVKDFKTEQLILQSGNTNIKLDYRGIIKGIFLENININKIKSLSLKLQEFNHIMYDSCMLRLFLVKYCKNCYYLSFDNTSFTDDNLLSGINFDTIYNITLNIESEIHQEITISAFTYNILRLQSGIAGLCFLLENKAKPIRKIIKNDNICPISHELIKKGDKYMICNNCCKNFSLKNIDKWIKNYQKNCPHCRADWINNQIYINN